MLIPIMEGFFGPGPTPTAVPTVFAPTKMQVLTNYLCGLSQLTIFLCISFARFF